MAAWQRGGVAAEVVGVGLQGDGEGLRGRGKPFPLALWKKHFLSSFLFFFSKEKEGEKRGDMRVGVGLQGDGWGADKKTKREKKG